jgi:hypothetical protein
VIVAELERPDGETLAGRRLKVRELTGSQVSEVARLARRYIRPSRSDLFALVLARSQSAILLTGDRHLRSAAESEGVKVHGTLWLIDEMVAAGLLLQREAAAKLLRMVQAGRGETPRAPSATFAKPMQHSGPLLQHELAGMQHERAGMRHGAALLPHKVLFAGRAIRSVQHNGAPAHHSTRGSSDATHGACDATRQFCDATHGLCSATRGSCDAIQGSCSATRGSCDVTHQFCDATHGSCSATLGS